MSRRLRGFVAAALFVCSAPVTATPPEPLPVEFFASPLKFKNAQLSPDGEHIAFTYEEGVNEGKLAIATVDLDEITAVYEFGDNYHVGIGSWASDERLVMSVWKNTGYLDGRRQDLQWFVAGHDGDNRRQLGTGAYSAQIVDMLETDPRHILVARRYFGAGDGSMKLHRVDVVNGRSDYFRGTPAPNENSQIINVELDSKDRVRVAVEWDEGEDRYDGRDDVYRMHFKPLDGDWKVLALDMKRPSPTMWPLGFGPGDEDFYFVSNHDQPGRDTTGVFRFDFDSETFELVFRHPDVNIEGAIRGPWDEVLGVRYSPGYPTNHYFDPGHPLVQRMKALEAAFPGQLVSVTSYSLDSGKATVQVSSDRNPGELYLFEDGKLKFLAAAKPGLDKRRLGTQEAFTLEARDGVKLYGLLTLPPGREAKDLPMVVYPHGGPHGPYDRWGYDPDVQLMASHGYAVLQVNFRGSGGYGTWFEQAGYREWGNAMQDDVTDATLWAIGEGIADPDRICIAGGSYGGYATLQGVVREPDLYQCAIPIAGVFSLPMMRKRGDFRMNPGAANAYFDMVHGKDEAQLIARSPAYHVDRIKAELFIIHGSEDVRVPLTQAEFLREQLDEAGKDYEWMVRKEGHGFTQLENRVDMYTAMLDFLDRHIGDKRVQRPVETVSR